jgi:hypothetical protein
MEFSPHITWMERTPQPWKAMDNISTVLRLLKHYQHWSNLNIWLSFSIPFLLDISANKNLAWHSTSWWHLNVLFSCHNITFEKEPNWMLQFFKTSPLEIHVGSCSFLKYVVAMIYWSMGSSRCPSTAPPTSLYCHWRPALSTDAPRRPAHRTTTGPREDATSGNFLASMYGNDRSGKQAASRHAGDGATNTEQLSGVTNAEESESHDTSERRRCSSRVLV